MANSHCSRYCRRDSAGLSSRLSSPRSQDVALKKGNGGRCLLFPSTVRSRTSFTTNCARPLTCFEQTDRFCNSPNTLPFQRNHLSQSHSRSRRRRRLGRNRAPLQQSRRHIPLSSTVHDGCEHRLRCHRATSGDGQQGIWLIRFRQPLGQRKWLRPERYAFGKWHEDKFNDAGCVWHVQKGDSPDGGCERLWTWRQQQEHGHT